MTPRPHVVIRSPGQVWIRWPAGCSSTTAPDCFRVTVADEPGLAAIVSAVRSDIDERAADIILDHSQPLAGQTDRLWADRVGPCAHAMAALAHQPGPPLLRDHDPQLLIAA